MHEDNQLSVAYVGLGSNMGDRQAYLQEAIHMLNQHAGTRVVRESSIYETDPVGYLEQPAYLNMVVALETIWDPLSLLHDLLDMELQLGRIRTIRWGPRTIDLDLLLYNHVRMDTPELILPHPRMLERAFVMIPLIEIANSFYLKELDVENWTASKGKEGIKIWTPMP